MTQQELEQALQQHTIEIAEIRQILAQVAGQQEVNSQQIAATMEQTAANMEQIAANTAGLTELRSILADYLRGRSQFDR